MISILTKLTEKLKRINQRGNIESIIVFHPILIFKAYSKISTTLQLINVVGWKTVLLRSNKFYVFKLN